MTDPGTYNRIRQLLTQPQWDAWRRQADGLGTRQIAIILDISRSSVIDRLDNAYRTLRHHGITQDANGNWHQEPT